MTNPNDPSNRKPQRGVPDSGDDRATPNPEQNGRPDDTGAETPGDLNAADIVGPVGEEMPVQTHDEVDTVH